MSETRAARLRDKSSARRLQQKAEVRQALLDAASELFLEGGLEGFSLRGVAERVGYSATTVYLYFENKDDLLFAVVMEGFERFGEALQGAYDSVTDAVERIEATGRAYIHFGLTHPAHYRLMFMQRGDFLFRENPKNQKPTIDSFGVLVRAVGEALAAGRLVPADPLTHAYTLWAGVHGLVALALGVPTMGATGIEARTDALMATLRGGIESRGEVGRTGT